MNIDLAEAFLKGVQEELGLIESARIFHDTWSLRCAGEFVVDIFTNGVVIVTTFPFGSGEHYMLHLTQPDSFERTIEIISTDMLLRDRSDRNPNRTRMLLLALGKAIKNG